jgi:hypothetical protein
MTYWQLLWRVELRAVTALLIGALLMALYVFADSLRASAIGSTMLVTPLDAAWGGFLYTIFFGVLPVILYGAPLYAFLRYKNMATWLSVVLAGVAPGIVMYSIGARDLKSDLTGWFIIGGVVVSCVVHLLSSYGRLQLKERAPSPN